MPGGFTLDDNDGDDNHSQFTFAGAHDPTKLNFYYEKENKIVKAVFLPADSWYTVEEEDFFTAEELSAEESPKKESYFVGASSTANQGVNFSNISEPLNVTLDTEYELPNISYWVNSIYSVVGGAGDTTITGSEHSDTIIGGGGNATLWGGSSAVDDLLIGGSAHNSFSYRIGNGKDTIRGTNDGDEIILADVSMDQIVSAQITAYSVDINFSDGGSLYVEGRSDITYQLAEGSKYFANHENSTWSLT